MLHAAVEVLKGEILGHLEKLLGPGCERQRVGMATVGAGIHEGEAGAEILGRPGGRAEVSRTVRSHEDDEEAHRDDSTVPGRLRQNAPMAKSRTEDEQKAVEAILRGLGQRLMQLRDDHKTKAMRGDEPEGISQGLEIALKQLNDMLPRRKRIKDEWV